MMENRNDGRMGLYTPTCIFFVGYVFAGSGLKKNGITPVKPNEVIAN